MRYRLSVSICVANVRASLLIACSALSFCGEQPRFFFVHFWENDDALKLAKGVQAALEKMAVARNRLIAIQGRLYMASGLGDVAGGWSSMCRPRIYSAEKHSLSKMRKMR